MKTQIDAIQPFVSAVWTSMSRAEYDSLPDRQTLSGLPVHGVTYRDSAHPGLIYRCRQGANWHRYAFTVLRPELKEC